MKNIIYLIGKNKEEVSRLCSAFRNATTINADTDERIITTEDIGRHLSFHETIVVSVKNKSNYVKSILKKLSKDLDCNFIKIHLK